MEDWGRKTLLRVFEGDFLMRIIPRNSRLRRGTILMTTLVLMAVAAFGALLMSRTLLDQNNLNLRRRELARALYAAEAGVALVQHWSNFPADYTPDPTLFVRGAGTPYFQRLSTVLAGGGVTISASTLAGLGEGRFTSDFSYAVSQIDKIEILPPHASDPIASFCKIRCTGRSANGITRVIRAYATISQPITVSLPAALLSYNVASAFGNARIHWGEAWSKANFNMLNKSQMDYVAQGSLGYDAWAVYRTEGSIIFPNNWHWGNGQDLYDSTRQQPGLAPASGNYANAFQQHVPPGTLQWPTFDYLTFKNMAKAHGRYYSTDASGNIYRDGIEDTAHRVDFLTEFGVPNRDTAPYDLLFIDTIDNTAPKSDGSNLATISATGNSLGLKGIFWIGANFDGGGVGSPPFILDAQDPAGNPPPGGRLSQIFLEGVLYAAGTVAMSGNCGVYGSVVAQRGFSGGGTPDIWYNHKLAAGLELDNGNVGSNLAVALEKAY